jgi:anti-sigma factor RsiW
MTSCDRIGRWLDGYHDGELGLLRRWQVGRHLARCPGCRSELGGLLVLGDWIREVAAVPEPDLWSGVAARLPSAESTTTAAPAIPERRWRLRLTTPVLGGAFAVVAAGVLLVRPELLAPVPAPSGVVRSLNSHGRPVMVLEGKKDAPATVIWLMEEQHDPNPEEVADVPI